MLLLVKMETIRKAEVLTVRMRPVWEIFRLLNLVDRNAVLYDGMKLSRSTCIYILSISFCLFILVISIICSKPLKCEQNETKIDEPSPRFRRRGPSPVYLDATTPGTYDIDVAPVNRFIVDSDFSFFPEEKDIVIIDEESLSQPPKLVRIGSERDIVADRDALTSVKMALKFKEKNNIEKAQKLFEHAIAMSPNHPEVILHYGEFLESGQDYLNADHFYLKALILRPKDSRALENRRRLLPVVNKLDSDQLSRIDKKKKALLYGGIAHDAGLKRFKKEFYFQHIYHTVGIEGNTMDLIETRTVIETGMAVHGKSVFEHNELLGVDAAMRYINRTLIDSKHDITLDDILEIHKRVLGNADPINAGTFRKTQVYVGGYTPPAPSEVEALMEELVEMLQMTDGKIHPIHLGALAHHKLVNIHPFIDGNGRTARLLMNVYIIRAGYPPIVIRKEDRTEYYKYLQIANEGDIRPFYRFIARNTEYTIDAFLYARDCKKTRCKALELPSDVRDVIPLGS